MIILIPGTILLVPRFILANQLGMRDSYWVLSSFTLQAVSRLRSFDLLFRSQPAEMFEAARIDGASEMRALLSIAIPCPVRSSSRWRF